MVCMMQIEPKRSWEQQAARAKERPNPRQWAKHLEKICRDSNEDPEDTILSVELMNTRCDVCYHEKAVRVCQMSTLLSQGVLPRSVTLTLMSLIPLSCIFESYAHALQRRANLVITLVQSHKCACAGVQLCLTDRCIVDSARQSCTTVRTCTWNTPFCCTVSLGCTCLARSLWLPRATPRGSSQ